MRRILLFALMVTLLAAGCTAPNSKSGDTAVYLERTRPEEMLLLPEDSAAAYMGFSTELLKAVCETEDENPLISPASVYFALAMTANGAAGETKAAFEDVLGLTVEALNQTCRALMNNLALTEGSTKLNIADSLWIDKDEGYEISEEFVKLLNETYFAEVYQTDLQRSKQSVNNWVSYHTEELIPFLLEEEPSDDARLLIINTLYLKAAWESEFDPNNNRKRDFARKDGSAVKTEFLNAELKTQQCIITEEALGVLLPYDDGKLAFLALKPVNGDVRSLIAGFDEESLETYLSAAEERMAWLSMPKFTLDDSIVMNDALKGMGLENAFDSTCADFSGIAPELFISRVLQKTKLEVNEKGTEAAAATVVEMRDGAGMLVEDPVELNFDSPYLYAVVDLQSGLPLFLGIMEDPT